MARRRRRDPYTIDLCAVNLAKMRKLSPDALLKIWTKLGASHPTRDRGTQLIKAYASNVMAGKLAAQIHTGKMKRDTLHIYARIIQNIRKDIKHLQEARCVTSEGRTIHRYRRTA
jgi:hypothetical protein